MALTRVLRGGTVYDGSGCPGRIVDVGIEGDRVVLVGDLPEAHGAHVINAQGAAVVPGFINTLSHAWGSLQVDGSGASDVLQGVTTEVLGEGFSLGPGAPGISALVASFGEQPPGVQVIFNRLCEGLDHLERCGIATNVASYIGGHNLRMQQAGFENRPLSGSELDRACETVEEEMQEGALGIGTALIYPPGNFASTAELTALCEPVARHGGTYVSHLRSEGSHLLESLDELIHIGAQSGCRTEVFHLKAAGRDNWDKMSVAIERIEQARATGHRVGANMYPYSAGSTALHAAVPPRFHVGGPEAFLKRLADPAERREMAAEITSGSSDFDNLFLGSGGGAGILFATDLHDGPPARGRMLHDIADDLGLEPVMALLEIITREPGVNVAYFLCSEEGVEHGLKQPWVSIGSDAAAQPAERPFIDLESHPRAYGSFARFLGHYVREKKVVGFAEAVRRMTRMPADDLGLVDRGRIEVGSFADVVVLDENTIDAKSTYTDPHLYANGVRHVLVNGQPCVADGKLLSARPGRRLRRGS